MLLLNINKICMHTIPQKKQTVKKTAVANKICCLVCCSKTKKTEKIRFKEEKWSVVWNVHLERKGISKDQHL